MTRQGRLTIILTFFVLFCLSFSSVPSVAAQTGSNKPILVVVNDSATNKFGRYLGEILIAEGLNSFDVTPVTSVTTTVLNQYKVVVLAETPLTSTQASTFSTYVNGGGYLVAMRPDSQIAGLFGLGSNQGIQTDGYLKMTGLGPGQGLSTATLQIHGTVDKYATVGATVIAQLYSTATTSTSNPAVAQSTDGRNTAFLYDLARNIVYTRQGNPANANVDVDGDGVLRSIDLFYNANGSSWIDKDKTPIPQADEQQRLFARIVQQAINAAYPMPQLWYFPGTSKTMLISTGDAHANPTTTYQTEVSILNSHNAKITIYLSIGGDLTNSTVQTWRGQGHEVGIHPYSYSPNSYTPYNILNLNQGYDVYQTWFNQTFTSTKSRTVRNHQVAWLGWTDGADIAVNHGMAMDANFYNWGPWLRKSDGTWAHGYITGSGQPMKFMKADGTILPYYQQLTQLVDEQFFQVDPGYTSENLSVAGATAISQQLIDASQAGDYAAIMTQFHVDYIGIAGGWVDATLGYAQSKGIPMWNADTWLNFTELRHAATYNNVNWDGTNKILTFNLSAASSPSFSLSTMLPLSYGGNSLQAVFVDGVATTVTQQTIKGVNVGFVTVPAGNHAFTAAYTGNGVIPTSTFTFTPTFTPTLTPSNTPNGSPTATSTATSTPDPGVAFPSTSILDSFTRANGILGSSWTGSTSGYAIATNTMDVGSGGDIYWGAVSFGASQEAFVKLTTVDLAANEIDLILKSQISSSWSGGLLEVLYSPASRVVQVWSFTSAQGWVKYGADIPVTLASGDQFGARAMSDGQVYIYQNGILLGSRSVATWTYASSGGFIGLWLDSASASFLDDFGGGVVASGPAPTSTSTPLPTSTSTPSNTPSATFTPSSTPSRTPTATATATNTATVTATASNTPTATSTSTPSNTPSSTPTTTPSSTPTATFTPSNTPTITATSTSTDTPTATNTPSNTPLPSNTPVPTATNTPTDTPLPSDTPTATSTATATNTPTATTTPTNTPTATLTPSLTATTSGSVFPSAALLDQFNRANGALGSSWSGGTNGYTIATNRVDVGNGGSAFWAPTSFSSNQEVYVTLSTIDATGAEVDLLLKSQSRTTWANGLIEVWYNAATRVVQVWTYASGQNWVQQGADIPVTLVSGDVFGARATADGQVRIYRNGTLLATRDIRSWPYYTLGGYIGLWYDNAPNSFFDDFGGGNAVP